MAKLFNIDKSSKLNKEVVIAKFATTSQHGAMPNKTQQSLTNYYNLDAILLVGYKANLERRIKFRKWAKKILKDYMLKGYAINERRLETLNKTVEIQNNKPVLSNLH